MADEQHKYEYLTGKIITRNEDGGGGGDFEEHQMWDSSMHETNSSSAHYYHNSSSSTTSKLQFGRPGGGSSSTKSAPMAIPDWQKIYGTATHEATTPQPNHNEEIFFKDEDDSEGEVMIPPHEYIAARKLASSQISSFSVCEGAGRTLKGRDLSRVRNAILTKTGFIE